ncbi:MAG: gcvT [Pseudonocardiales bacterium]|nr:gcvT [Pseudonocardiales bacterium]
MSAADTTAATAAPRRTALYDVHVSLGAMLTDFAGWLMPLRYTSESAEHRAVRSAAGLFDLSHMGQIDVVGPEAAAALDYALTGFISLVKDGRARYTMICAPDGGVIDDLVVYRLGGERFLVIANASNAAAVFAALTERVADFDTTATLRADAALIAVQGPASAAIIEAAIGRTVEGLPYYASQDAIIDGEAVLLARTGYTGEDGFEIFCPGPAAARLWALLTSLGSDAGLIPAGLSCRDTLRLEAGMPLYGNELSLSGTPYEAGLGRVVRLDKPSDFVGRAALAERGTAPVRTLVGLHGLSRRVPRHGFAVLDASGAVIGEVTSGAPSPTLGYPIAMAYLDAAHAGVTEVAIDIRGSAEPAQVVPLPFYKRA